MSADLDSSDGPQQLARLILLTSKAEEIRLEIGAPGFIVSDLSANLHETNLCSANKEQFFVSINAKITRLKVESELVIAPGDEDCNELEEDECHLVVGKAVCPKEPEESKEECTIDNPVESNEEEDFSASDDEPQSKRGGNEIAKQEVQCGAFRCSKCRIWFTRRDLKSAHMRECRRSSRGKNGSERRCSETEFIATTTKTVANDSVPPARPETCAACGLTLPSQPKMLVHMKEQHDAVIKYTCSFCGKCFVKRGIMLRHQRLHTGEKSYKCDTCGMTFTWQASLRFHKILHHKTEEPKYKCDVCGKAFFAWSQLKAHLTVHSSETFECDDCGRIFKSRPALQLHAKKHEGIEYPCDKCERKYSTHLALRKHQRMHLNVFAFKCSECGASYRRKTSLEIHMRLHTGVEPYRCDVCGKGFRSSSGLNTHKSIHDTVKSVTCEFCGKSFSSRRNLRPHIRIHLNDKRYVCEVCGKGFVQKSSLKRHKTAHDK